VRRRHNPCKQQHDDLDEILEETDIAHQACDGLKDRPSGVQSNLCNAARLEQFGGGEACAAGFEAKPGKAFEDDPGETIPIADDISKGTNEQGLLDEPRDNVIDSIAAPGASALRKREIVIIFTPGW
jgi:hypothetical protein